MLVCWQELGFTKAGRTAGYRNLKLADIENIEITEQHFVKRVSIRQMASIRTGFFIFKIFSASFSTPSRLVFVKLCAHGRTCHKRLDPDS